MTAVFTAALAVSCGHELRPSNNTERVCHDCKVSGRLSWSAEMAIRDATTVAARAVCRPTVRPSRPMVAPTVRADVVADRIAERRRNRK